jgi:hypothetical protein
MRYNSDVSAIVGINYHSLLIECVHGILQTFNKSTEISLMMNFCMSSPGVWTSDSWIRKRVCNQLSYAATLSTINLEIFAEK